MIELLYLDGYYRLDTMNDMINQIGMRLIVIDNPIEIPRYMKQYSILMITIPMNGYPIDVIRCEIIIISVIEATNVNRNISAHGQLQTETIVYRQLKSATPSTRAQKLHHNTRKIQITWERI